MFHFAESLTILGCSFTIAFDTTTVVSLSRKGKPLRVAILLLDGPNKNCYR